MKYIFVMVVTLVTVQNMACFGPFDPNDWPPSEDTTTDTGVVFADDLIAYWNCDDSSGTTLRDGIGKMDATISGAVFEEGIKGGGLRFDGKNNSAVVYTATEDVFAFETGDFTVSLWVKPMFFQHIEDSSRFDILSRGKVRETGYTIAIAERSFTVIMGRSKNELNDTTFDATENRWYHLVVARNEGEVTMWVNGTVILSYSNTDDVSASDYKMIFGNNGSSGSDNGFSGVIDEIRFSDIAWTDSRVRSVYNAYKQ